MRLMKSVNNFAASLLRISLSKLILFDKHRPEINGLRVFWRHCACLCGFAPICMKDAEKNGRVRRKPLAKILFRLLWLAPHISTISLFLCVAQTMQQSKSVLQIQCPFNSFFPVFLPVHTRLEIKVTCVSLNFAGRICRQINLLMRAAQGAHTNTLGEKEHLCLWQLWEAVHEIRGIKSKCCHLDPSKPLRFGWLKVIVFGVRACAAAKTAVEVEQPTRYWLIHSIHFPCASVVTNRSRRRW